MFGKSIFGKSMRSAGAVAIAGAIAILAPLSAEAFEMGRYRLHSHDKGGLFNDGNGTSPKYGLRMDGMLGGGAVTFDFDRGNSEVYLEYDGTKVSITGKAFGGELANSTTSYGADSGYWNIDMTYKIDRVESDGSLWVDDSAATGTITEVGGLGRSFNLAEKRKVSNGVETFSFALDTGHRGTSYYSGWGWVMKQNSDGDYVRNKTQDFLFKVGDKVSVPEPGTLLGLLGVGALGLGTAAKRQQQQDS